jgi:putative lipoprotein
VSLVYKIFLITFLFTVSSQASEPGKRDTDRWFARDKYEHFILSAFYSAGTAKIAHRHFEIEKKQSIALGFSFTISLGAAKELVDFRSGKGNPSFKDFIWDIAGALAGSIAVGLKL